jgi:hypothetical protein
LRWPFCFLGVFFEKSQEACFHPAGCFCRL